ncbi:MAG TPA: bifunctional 4-hydroxy-2-oxoglutarate aldolase/2-dehydro-3-deoxy-phosphogluconate aldolase [Christensenellaceae bacterium]|jgi:2-dehydro-3-deoxyphosphogluconate aldolase/(4S)-4-hydroxy-2-oxoglutarate aldolase|nr:bifunctional 4-hydroxy-2-oxoglutarate aldolase/2-dehydro-3-deoxy-phosphogluconate aldolase [Christensenellaceae bacterium]
MDTVRWIRDRKIVAIVRNIPNDYILKLANALYIGGIDIIEIAFNSDDPSNWINTATAIEIIAENMKGKMLIGAGTVLNMKQLELAKNAGAKFIVSPNVNIKLIKKAKKFGLFVLPGALTPTEIEVAHEAGANIIKLFPAGIMKPEYIKAVKAPFPHIGLIAVGGVNVKNASDFITAGCCGIGLGGNLVNKDWIISGEFNKITSLAQEYRKAVDNI